MILMNITISIFIIGLMLAIIGKVLKRKKMLISGICIILLLIISIIIFFIYEMEKEQEQLENQNLGQIADNTTLPVPDRIVYKDSNNKYTIIYSNTSAFTKIYSELYNRLTNIIEGKVISENEITQMQEQGSFIEFDYNTKSKNFVFMLEEDEIGAIKRFSDTGQVIKTSLDNVEELVKMTNKLTKQMDKYDFDKTQSYISSTKLIDFPSNLEFVQERSGIYQKIIRYDSEDYKNTLEQLDFKVEGDIPNVDFDKKNVVITISQYKIDSIKQNIGNIKYEFGNLEPNYSVNMLVVSKVVNTNCIYYNISDSAVNTELSNIVNMTRSGTIRAINGNEIEIGLGSYVSDYIIKLNNNTFIKDYETNKEIGIGDLKVGDSIYVEGETAKDINGLKAIKANRIEICSKEKVKNEIMKYIKDTYRIDGMGIEYTNVDNEGNGYIIVTASFENFIYPLKLNVNSQTETFLGMGYHIQSNYGYVLHEMCDITLDTKIVDADNIEGVVKTIEYIAD